MLINWSVLRLVPSRLLKALKLKVRLIIGKHDLVIPVEGGNALQTVFWKRSWKTEVIERLVGLREGAFLDVGANLGQTLLDLQSTHPGTPYVGFEPNAACAGYLHDLIKANSLQNYSIVPIGLTDEAKIVPLYVHRDVSTDSCGTIIKDLRPGRAYDMHLVYCFRFDDIREALGVESIGFVKIDVEGAELEALIGMRSSLQAFRPLILCEVLYTDSQADLSVMKSRNDRLMRLLADLRYEALQLIKSPDDACVVAAEKIQRFHSAHWTTENKDSCDYLFIPTEDEGALKALLPRPAAQP